MKTLKEFNIYDGIKTVESNRQLKRVSRWIEVKHAYNVNKRNSLYDYATDEYGYHPYQDGFNPANGLYLDYFRFNGKTYAIEQFYGIGSIADAIGHSMGYIEDKEEHYISAYDSENYFSPYYIELDEYGEHVRIYEEV